MSTIEQNPVRTTPAPTGGRAPSGPTRTAWAIVARREILAKIFDKSFLVGTVLTVAVIAGFMVVSAFMEDRTKTYDLVASGADVSFARTLASEVTAVDDKVIVDGDSKGDSFLIALRREDGKTLWRIRRENKGISYSAPLIRKIAGRHQLIQCGDRCVTSFDPDTGQVIWKVDGPSQEFVATPVYSETAGLVFVSSSWPKQVLLAIRPDGDGDVTETHVAWSDTKGAPYVPSMIVAGDFLLTINNSGVAFCYEAATGKAPQDLLEDDYLEILDGQALEPRLLYPNGYKRVNRFAFVIQGILTAIVFTATGYVNPTEGVLFPVQPVSALFGLRLLTGGFTALALVAAFVLLGGYRLHGARAERVRAEAAALQARKREAL